VLIQLHLKTVQKQQTMQKVITDLWMTHIPAIKMKSPTATAMQSIRTAVKPARKQKDSQAIYAIWFRQISSSKGQSHGNENRSSAPVALAIINIS